MGRYSTKIILISKSDTMKIEYLKLYWCKIRVFDERGRAYGVKECKVWDDLQFNLLCKYRWYFDYRSALLKVQNPKCKVEIITGSKEPNRKTIQDFLKDKIILKCKFFKGFDIHKIYQLSLLTKL